MQQGGSQYGVSSEMTPFAATTTTTSTRTHVLGGADQQQQQLKLGDPTLAVAEEASPISSRPPAHSSAGISMSSCQWAVDCRMRMLSPPGMKAIEGALQVATGGRVKRL
ncbi:hypothetical protein CK203_113653 [Vitis vinifera]|uniref:Uncharacterized protein n=1 Tax=Vitis vinifera TaxID=29760 RepID=A0A438EG66_VITVI|nr:hypothetical protein CK203_113653 [Vitis vinifera]